MLMRLGCEGCAEAIEIFPEFGVLFFLGNEIGAKALESNAELFVMLLLSFIVFPEII